MFLDGLAERCSSSVIELALELHHEYAEQLYQQASQEKPGDRGSNLALPAIKPIMPRGSWFSSPGAMPLFRSTWPDGVRRCGMDWSPIPGNRLPRSSLFFVYFRFSSFLSATTPVASIPLWKSLSFSLIEHLS